MKALLILAALTACAPVHAQDAPPEPQCAPYELLVAGLARNYGENRRVVGMAGTEGRLLFEVYANDETSTWTAITVTPEGTACLLASGDMFSGVPSELPKAGIDG